MRLVAALLVVALSVAPEILLADPLSQRGLEDGAKPAPVLTDEMVEEQKRSLDRVLAKRTEDATKEAADGAALETKLKQERIDFEKKQIADRREFLEKIKSETDPKKRNSAYGKFNTDQRNARRRFFNTQNGQRADLAQGFRQARQASHEEVVVNLPPPAKATPSPVKSTKKKSP